ncbi:MAG: lysophospholipid acyltransferase family protein, partial [Candidatus Kapabacteria bacterium]|nr:lysophospholipid acyltransferase family protein [Candidatus Kapabacteria bacterium]
RTEIMRGSYENLGIVMVELLSTPSMSRQGIVDIVDIPGFNEVLERHRAGKATIFLSAHYGNWEYLAMAAGILLDAPITIVVHPQSNAMADERLNTYRSQYGNVVVPMGEAARPLIRTLTSGGTVAFLVDQYGQYDKDPWIEFFGRPTPTYEAPAALALKYNVPIYYAFAERLPDGRYHAPIRQLPMDDLTNDHDGIVELTRRHVRVLEDAIRKRPELWSWQHRRWRE